METKDKIAEIISHTHKTIPEQAEEILQLPHFAQMRDRIVELERNETHFRNFIITEHLTELWDLFFKTALNNKQK